MRTKISQLELALSEKTTQYEKDQILWDGKIKFVEQQRDILKKENSEANKRFENMLETIQKKNIAEKESLENDKNLTISNMEQKFQKQLKDLQDNHSKLYTELLNHSKELEEELKISRMENIENNNKKNTNNELAQKIEEINAENEKYRKNEDILKEEQDKKIVEINSNFDKEKQNYKNKISEIEKNLREAEGKRGALLLELETEKAKWNIEKDNLINKYQELSDKMITLEKKYENLLRENEKLKNEKSILRRNKNSESRFTSHLGLGSKKLEANSAYKSAMFKVLGDYSEEKNKGDKINKNLSKNFNKENSNDKDNNGIDITDKIIKEEDKKE
jgi:chromosome segregation ATPase